MPRKKKTFRLMPLPKFLERLGACPIVVREYRAFPLPTRQEYLRAYKHAIAKRHDGSQWRSDLMWLARKLPFSPLEREIIWIDVTHFIRPRSGGEELSLIATRIGFPAFMEIIIDKQKRMRANDRRKAARKAAQR